MIANSNPPLCQHCKQYAFDCTFFLPITETRFKKRKVEEEAAAAAAAAAIAASNDGPSGRSSSASGPGNIQFARNDSIGRSGQGSGSPGISAVSGLPPPSASSSSNVPRSEAKIYGPTSLSYILHASDTMPQVNTFNLRYHQTWKVGLSGEGFISVHEQREPTSSDHHDGDPDSEEKKPERIEREVLEKLVNYYFKNIAPIFPVVTEHEFLNGASLLFKSFVRSGGGN